MSAEFVDERRGRTQRAPRPLATIMQPPGAADADGPPSRLVARVKWFDPVRGYGFAAIRPGEDVFLYKTHVAALGRDPQPGERITFIPLPPRNPGQGQIASELRFVD